MPGYITIRVRRETKQLLEKTLIDLEARLGRRLGYDKLLHLLARRTQAKLWLPKMARREPGKGALYPQGAEATPKREKEEGHRVFENRRAGSFSTPARRCHIISYAGGHQWLLRWFNLRYSSTQGYTRPPTRKAYCAIAIAIELPHSCSGH